MKECLILEVYCSKGDLNSGYNFKQKFLAHKRKFGDILPSLSFQLTFSDKNLIKNKIKSMQRTFKYTFHTSLLIFFKRALKFFKRALMRI